MLELCADNPALKTVALATEEEGVAVAAGAWLGGQRAALLMQSSGLGNCVNAIASITLACRLPLLMLITMRGDWDEGNPWQVPMGQTVAPLLSLLNTKTETLSEAAAAGDTLAALGRHCFMAQQPAALLISQRLVGAKVFKEPLNKS